MDYVERVKQLRERLENVRKAAEKSQSYYDWADAFSCPPCVRRWAENLYRLSKEELADIDAEVRVLEDGVPEELANRLAGLG